MPIFEHVLYFVYVYCRSYVFHIILYQSIRDRPRNCDLGFIHLAYHGVSDGPRIHGF